MGFDMTSVNNALGAAVNATGGDITSKLQSAQGGQMSEIEMLELQHSLNRWSIMINLQSNVMKTWSDALKSVVQNLR